MQSHKIAVRPVRIVMHDPERRVDVLRGVGYRFVCSCGELGPRRYTFAAAREEGMQHRADTRVDQAVIPRSNGHDA